MKRLALIAIAPTLLLAGAAMVDNRSRSPGAVPLGEYYAYVYKVFVSSDNHLRINVWRGAEGNFTPAQRANCSDPWYAEFEYPLGDVRTEAVERIAMASLMARIKVYAKTDGCTTDGNIKLVGLQLER